MIEARGVSRRYGDSLVVDDVNLQLPAGGVVAIIGPNGAGKSTLLSMISRLLPMSTGSVAVDGINVSSAASDQLAKRLAILRQDNHISSRLTVRELVSFGRYPHSKGRTNAEDLVHVERSMAYVGIESLSDRFLDELSGGQRQRAFVAMVLCQDTDYVLLDEPLNNLDMPHAVGMMKQLRQAADDLHRTFVLVLHDINFASCYADHIVVMKNGRVVHQGPPDQIVQTNLLREVYGIEVQVHQIEGRRIGVYYR